MFMNDDSFNPKIIMLLIVLLKMLKIGLTARARNRF